MRLRVAVVAAALVLSGAPAPAKKPKTLPCPVPLRARFLNGSSQPLIAGSTTPTDALVVDTGSISIGTACPPAKFKTKAKKGLATTITAKFAGCDGLPPGKVALKADLTTASHCQSLTGTLKAKKKPKQPFTVALSVCGDGIPDPGNGEECDESPCSGGRTCTPDCACVSTTTTPTTTSTTLPTACCGAERITLQSATGTLIVDSLAPFPFPAGVVTSLDVKGASIGLPECRHDVVVPAGGFTVPHFDIPLLDYCSEIVNLKCETGDGHGAGSLWDGNGSVGMAMTNISTVGDTSDGVCDPTPFKPFICDRGTNVGKTCLITADCPADPLCTSDCQPHCTNNCNGGEAGLGNNTLGDIDVARSASTSRGIRSAVDLHLGSITWKSPGDQGCTAGIDPGCSGCHPASDPGCCVRANYGDDPTDEVIAHFDFIATLTTDVATAQFVDKNSDGCAVAGRGFGGGAVTMAGPRTLVGAPAPGPCCAVGQPTTLVSVGLSFSDFAPFADLGFQVTMPSAVASCGTPGTASCVVTTDACRQ